MSKKRLDPRVRRTRKWLQQALIDLIQEKEYQKISIAEIADRADVARPTFYLHYSSKDDLLLSYLDVIFEEFLTRITHLEDGTQGKLATMLFELIQNHKVLTQLTLNDETSIFILERLQSYIEVVFAMFIEQKIFPDSEVDPDLRSFAISGMAGASYALLIKWIKMDMPYSPEVMGELLLKLMAPGLVDVLVNDSMQDVL